MSYSDYWLMTFGEIAAAVRADAEFRESKVRNMEMIAAYAAYHAAALSRCDVRHFPRTMKAAFPSLFGRTSDGQIPAGSWREAQEAFEMIAVRHNANMKAG